MKWKTAPWIWRVKNDATRSTQQGALAQADEAARVRLDETSVVEELPVGIHRVEGDVVKYRCNRCSREYEKLPTHCCLPPAYRDWVRCSFTGIMEPGDPSQVGLTEPAPEQPKQETWRDRSPLL